jgi:hypothetical protein
MLNTEVVQGGSHQVKQHLSYSQMNMISTNFDGFNHNPHSSVYLRSPVSPEADNLSLPDTNMKNSPQAHIHESTPCCFHVRQSPFTFRYTFQSVS